MTPDDIKSLAKAADMQGLSSEFAELLAALDEAQQDAARLQWLLKTDGDWAICEWDSNEVEGIGYYRDARDPATVRAAIDAARAGDAA